MNKHKKDEKKAKIMSKKFLKRIFDFFQDNLIMLKMSIVD